MYNSKKNIKCKNLIRYITKKYKNECEIHLNKKYFYCLHLYYIFDVFHILHFILTNIRIPLHWNLYKIWKKKTSKNYLTI